MLRRGDKVGVFDLVACPVQVPTDDVRGTGLRLGVTANQSVSQQVPDLGRTLDLFSPCRDVSQCSCTGSPPLLKGSGARHCPLTNDLQLLEHLQFEIAPTQQDFSHCGHQVRKNEFRWSGVGHSPS